MSGGAGFLPSTVVYHNFRQLWLVFRGFKLMEINSNVFSGLQVVLMICPFQKVLQTNSRKFDSWLNYGFRKRSGFFPLDLFFSRKFR